MEIDETNETTIMRPQVDQSGEVGMVDDERPAEIPRLFARNESLFWRSGGDWTWIARWSVTVCGSRKAERRSQRERGDLSPEKQSLAQKARSWFSHANVRQAPRKLRLSAMF
jgi:hypothetical protein